MPPCPAHDHKTHQQCNYHHHHHRHMDQNMPRITKHVAVDGAIIIGAGPSGLATAACLQQLYGVPYVILERSDCIASLWKKHTYDRLHLHTAKHCCELPLLPFPPSYPTFLTRKQFVDYLETYASTFHIHPRFNESVQSAKYEEQSGLWKVLTTRRITVNPSPSSSPPSTTSSRLLSSSSSSLSSSESVLGDEDPTNDDAIEFECIEYAGKWLVVATGENAEPVLPRIPGLKDFTKCPIIHSSQYKNGSQFTGQKVLVIGAGNSGMEIALDLVNNGAMPSIVVRSPLHVLPREMFGKSTFSVAMTLTKLIPVRFVDYILVTYSQLKYGDTSLYGLRRPKVGPLELKNKMGKTPILDVGTVAGIRRGEIKVKPAVDSITCNGARFVDNSSSSFDAVILATGYRSAVPSWLCDEDQFFTEQGLSRSPMDNWKGKRGLYAAGLSGKGLLGATMDAQQIARDISLAYLSR